MRTPFLKGQRQIMPVVLLAIAVAGCNLPRTSNPPAAATLTPVAQASVEYVEGPELTEFFVEDLEIRVPEDWELSGDWTHSEGAVHSTASASEIFIPGTWQDMTLFLRMRLSQDGELTLRFNRSELGAYRLTLGPQMLSAFWEAAEGGPQQLQEASLSLDEDWHDLVVRLTAGRVEVLVDETLKVKFFDAYASPRGSLSVTNTGNGLVEIDRLDVAPPGMGPSAGPPSAPGGAALLDLSIFELSLENANELVVGLTNSGPDSTMGHTFILMITISSSSGGAADEIEPFTYRMDPEYINAFYVNTGFSIDLSQGEYEVTVVLEPLDFADPDPSNNLFRQTFSDNDL